MKVLVLGGTGMLGSMVAKVLPDEWETLVTARTPAPYPYELVNTRWRRFAVDHTAWQEDLMRLADGCDWIVNCLGATKPLMVSEGAVAYTVNAHFPEVVDRLGPPVIHPSTDCVFLGQPATTISSPPYSEDAPVSANTQYGRSKGEGEVELRNTTILRCSVIGPECRHPPRHLLGNVVEQSITFGYADHLWNGLTTLAWAKISMALMEHQTLRLLHLVPAGSCSKDRLVSTILQAFRLLWHSLEARSGEVVDTRLSTVNSGVMAYLWRAAGYDGAPTIEELVWELADFCRAEHWPTHAEGWVYWHTSRT